MNSTTLYIQYGEWGTGHMFPRNDTPAIYDVVIDTDLAQNFYAENAELPPISIDFGIPQVASLNFGGLVFPFVKNLTLDSLPSQPWDSASCGPVVA